MPPSPSGPDGYVFMTGCRPWPPPPEPDGRCGICKGNTPSHKGTEVCGGCHAATRAMQGYIRAQDRAARSAGAGDVADAERRAKDKLKAKHGRAKLSERERRHYWAGVGSRRDPDFNVNRTAARSWLREIGQVPDWSLALDRRGNVIGRVEPCDSADPASPTPGSISGSPSPPCGPTPTASTT